MFSGCKRLIAESVRRLLGVGLLCLAGVVASPVFAQTGDVAAGQSLYNDNCVACHGSPRGSSAQSATTVNALNAAINTQNQMQFMRSFLTADDICNIVTYIASAVGAANPGCGTGVTKNSLVLRSSSTTSPEMMIGKLVNNVLQFTSATDSGPAYRMLAVGDFNRNGLPDLAFQNMTQGEFGDVNSWSEFKSTNPVFWRQVKQVWDVQAVGDLDGDGVDDLVWRYVVTNSPDTGVSYIWFGSGGVPPAVSAVVSQVRKRGGAPLDWQLVGAVDINSDGAADMLYLSPAGQLRALMATPGRTCANLVVGNMPTGFAPLKFAKFRGGVSGEVLVRNATTGANQLLSLNAGGLVLPAYTGDPNDQNASCTGTSLTVPMTTITLPVADPTWTFYAAIDLNNDGTVDIVWKRPSGQLTVWLLRADGTLSLTLANAGTAPSGFSVMQNGGPKLF